jgi:hypothetical protein
VRSNNSFYLRFARNLQKQLETEGIDHDLEGVGVLFDAVAWMAILGGDTAGHLIARRRRLTHRVEAPMALLASHHAAKLDYKYAGL